MTQEILNDDDCLARTLFKPKDEIEIIDAGLKLIRISSNNFQFNSGNDNQESVNCQRLFGQDADKKCHDTGVKKAETNNERIVEQAKQRKERPKLREYIGFATSVHSDIKSVSNNDVKFEVSHHAENGNQAHCNITLILGDELQTKPKKHKTKFKNAAIALLSDKFQNFTEFSN